MVCPESSKHKSFSRAKDAMPFKYPFTVYLFLSKDSDLTSMLRDRTILALDFAISVRQRFLASNGPIIHLFR